MSDSYILQPWLAIDTNLKGIKYLPFSQFLSFVEEPNNESTNNQNNRQDGDSDEALLVFRPIDLLPYDKRQPGLEHISHFVHASDDQGPLLVIFRAYLMRPSVIIFVRISAV